MAERIISIHQPNFCPYAGIFEKIKQSDIFVIMSHCQYTKNNFQNRFYYKEKWHTMRCNQSHEQIIDKKYIYPHEDWKRITDSIPHLKVFDDCVTDSLWEMNGNIIREACKLLGITTPIVNDYNTGKKATERLIELIIMSGASTYLSGVSGRNYLELDKFEKAGIKVIFQENPSKKALCEIL